MNKKLISSWVLSILAGWAMFCVAAATTAGAESPVFVSPPTLPTNVEVTFNVLRIARIDPPAQLSPTAEIEGLLILRWKDPRLSFSAAQVGVSREVFVEHDADLKLDEIWWPAPIIQNESHKRQREHIELILEPDGSVTYEERFSAILPLDFDFHKFPFDTQQIPINLESFTWHSGEVVLIPSENGIGLAQDAKAPGWEILGIGSTTAEAREARGDHVFSAIRIQLSLEREAWQHLKTTMLPMLLVLCILCVATFAAIDSRIMPILVVMLAFVGLNGVIAKQLPPLSDFIFLDLLILLAYLAALSALAETVYVQRLSKRGEGARADAIEKRMRIGFPIILLCIVGLGMLTYL